MPKTKTKKKKPIKKSEKLRILAAGDIHGDTGLTKKLADRAKKENVDLVILTGDLTIADQPVKNLLSPFQKAGKQVLLVPGNHEPVSTVDFFSEAYPNVKNLHGYSMKMKDVGIFGAGGANIGVFQMKEKEIYDLLKKANKRVKNTKKKIMVTHVHPSGTLMEKMTTFFEGSKGVTRAIKQLNPDLAVCSHVHEAEGIEEKLGKTKVINVGRKGKIIEI